MTDATQRLVVGFAQELSAAAGSNPKAVFDAASFLITRQIFEAPFFPPLDATQAAAPKLFTGPLQADAERPGRAFHATIREDLKFSDGTPFEPRHLVSSLGESTNLARDVRVSVDGSRVSFELEASNPRFELQLAAQPLVALATGAGSGSGSSGVGGAIGTGAYRIVTASSSELVLGRNAHHPEPPSIAEVVFRSYPPDDRGRPRALLAALESGEVDLAPSLSWRDMSHLQRTAKVLRPVNSTGSLYLNTERLASRGVRRAIAFALNRLEIAQAAFGDNALAFQATGLLPPALGRQADGIAHSLAIARRLLEEDPQRPTAPLKLTCMFSSRPYLPDPAAIAEVVRRQLEKVGLSVTFAPPPTVDAYKTLIVAGDYDLLLSGNITDSSDPADFLRDLLSSNNVPETLESLSHAFNFARFRDTALDAALAQYRAERKPEGLQRITQILAEEVPLFPLLYGRASVAHSWRLKGFQPSVTAVWDFARLALR